MIKGLNGHFTKEHIKMAHKHKKKWAISYVIRKMHIKTTKSYYFPVNTMAKI